jgi:hypothetical protein
VGVCYCGCDCSLIPRKLPIRGVVLQQGLEAGMVAEGVTGEDFTDEIRALDTGGLINVRG